MVMSMKVKVLFLLIGLIIGIVGGWLIWGGVLRFGPTCPDGARPDANGCCEAEVYTDLGENGWNCCPPGDGDCFLPIK